MSLDTLSLIVQGASALGTVILAVAVWFQIRTSHQQVAATRETIDEMRESRRAQERPQVIVDADYSHYFLIYVVVRNIGRGAAKDIAFDFSAPIPFRSAQKSTSHLLY